VLPSEVDSGQYVVAYLIASPEELPPDFLISGALDDFQAGLFLPRDQPDWFGRSRYPPRVLSLVGDALRIDTHPCAGEPHQRIPLDELVYIESGHILLRGWLRLVACGREQTVLYSTVYRRTVDRFLRRLRARWMASERRTHPVPGFDLGQLSDVKFRNALARELDPEEVPSEGLFQAPRELVRHSRFRLWRSCTPGDLLALTPRRLLWITDRDRGTAARYGTITRYAPLRNILKIAWETADYGCALRIVLRAERHWHVPMRPEHRDAARRLESLYAESSAKA
jgi:hypothetical protein